MPTFLLIRHGETDYNKKSCLPGRLPEVHLNKTGQRQAQLVAEKLASLPLRSIYSSPLERTLETAQPLGAAVKLEIIPSPDLLETDVGDWQGESVKKLRRMKIWRSMLQNPALFRFPGGESILECQQRMVSFLEALRAQAQPHDLIACISHADPIKLLVAFYLGLPLDHFQRLTVDPGSITVLHVGETSARLIALNAGPSLAWEAFQVPAAARRKKASG